MQPLANQPLTLIVALEVTCRASLIELPQVPLQHYWSCLERVAPPSQSIWLVAADTDLEPPAALLAAGGIFVQRGLGPRSKKSFLVEAHGTPRAGIEFT